jgi:hypothetical protein
MFLATDGDLVMLEHGMKSCLVVGKNYDCQIE